MDTDICVARDFMRGHCCTKMDDSPLDGFRDSLTSSHGDGETVKGWFVSQLCPLMVTLAESCFQPNCMLISSHTSNYSKNIHTPILHTIEHILIFLGHKTYLNSATHEVRRIFSSYSLRLKCA